MLHAFEAQECKILGDRSRRRILRRRGFQLCAAGWSPEVCIFGSFVVCVELWSGSDIVLVREEDMRPAPAGKGRGDDAVVSGLVKSEGRLIAILNLQALFPGYGS